MVRFSGYGMDTYSLNPFANSAAFGIALIYEPLFCLNTKTGECISVIREDFTWAPDGSNLIYVGYHDWYRNITYWQDKWSDMFVENYIGLELAPDLTTAQAIASNFQYIYASFITCCSSYYTY